MNNIIINDYLNNSADFSQVYLIGSKYEILKALKKYLNDFPERSKEVEKIIDNLDELMQSKYDHETFLDVLFTEAQTELNKYDYFIFAYNLLTLSEDEAIEILRKKHLSDRQFGTFIKKIESKHPNQTEELTYIKNIYNKYKEKYNIKPAKVQNRSELYIPLDRDNGKRLEKFLDVYNSGYCIEEYCSYTGETVFSVTFAIKNMLAEDKEKYNIEYNEVLQRDNSEFYKYVKFVISKLLEIDKEEFTMMDYHTYLRLPQADFAQIANQVVEDKKCIKNLLISIKIAENKLPRISKVSELESRTVIAGREVTREEKEKIFNYLEENNYPINDYKIALRKYLNGTLIIEKKLELKK